MPSARKAERRKNKKRKPRPPPSSKKYLQYYQRECNSIDSRTFPQVKAQILDYLKDENCPAEVKIMFGDWMFRKIYMLFKFRGDALEDVCDDLVPAIEQCDETVIKSEYLQFHDYNAVGRLALNFYLDRFDDQDKYFILQMLNDVELVKNTMNSSEIDDETMKNHFVKWLKSSPVLEQQSNLLDVLLRYYQDDPDVREIFAKMRFGKRGQGTLYEDEQNVHDEDVHTSVLEAAARLISYTQDLEVIEIPDGVKYSDFMTSYMNRIYKDNNSRMVCKAVITRSCIDTTSFEGEDLEGKIKRFTIAEVLFALLSYIQQKSKEDAETARTLYEILLEEMEAMMELCSSGYIARFINVLRGFDERFEANITFEKQLYAVLSKAISDEMKKAPENVMAGSFEPIHRPEYVSYIQKTVEDVLPRLYSDYGAEDVEMHLAHTLSDITGFEGWRYTHKKLVYIEEDDEEEGFEEM